MNITRKVLVSQLRNVARSRWILGYGILLGLLTWLLLQFGGSGERALLSLLNVVLLLLPLVSVVFGTLYVYNAREFIEMLLAQPVSRGALYTGLFGGLVLVRDHRAVVKVRIYFDALGEARIFLARGLFLRGRDFGLGARWAIGGLVGHREEPRAAALVSRRAP